MYTCATCTHALAIPHEPPTCGDYDSGYFGAARLPRAGCAHWVSRVAGLQAERSLIGADVGPMMQSGGAEAPPYRIAEVACNFPGALTRTAEGTCDAS